MSSTNGTNNGRTVLVTGAISGLGQEAAAQLADDANRYLMRLEDGFRDALERGSESAEINQDMNGQRQQVLTAATLGINIAHRNDPTGSRARTLISALGAKVSSWARPHDRTSSA